jgi:hypothetical protein
MTRNTCYVLLVFMYLLHLIPKLTTSCAPAFFGIALHNVNVQSLLLSRGPKRDRTDDLLNANQALSQLSYGPIPSFGRLIALWWARVDLNHRPHAYQACALTS